MAKFRNIVKYTGLDKLTLLEKIKLKNIAESKYSKISRLFQDKPADVSINVKIYDKEKKRKYSLHGKVEAATRIFSASASDWDIKKTTHEVMDKLESEVKKQFKPQTKEWRRKGGFKNFIAEKFSK